MDVVLRIDSSGIRRSLKELQRYSKRSTPDLINLAGQLWSSFAYKHTRVATPAHIKRYLTAKVGRKASKRSRHKYGGTRAERIVISILRKSGQLAVLNNKAEFANRVRQFVDAAVKSSGYHRAGWIPALRQFKTKESKKRGAGRYREPVPGDAAKAHRGQANPHAFLENFARAFAHVQGSVLIRTEPQVARLLEAFALEDMVKNSRRAGFKA